MMKMFRSRAALAAASLAVVAMTATPALARHWRHRDRVDTGDVLAGLLVIGGIAAVASAASKSNRDREARDYRYPDRYPDADYRDYRDNEGRYGAPRSEENYAGGSSWRDSGNIDGAVNACLSEIERGERQVDTVEGVNRAEDGWRIDGRLRDGRAFSCTTGPDASIRRATVDGRALT